MLASEIRRLRPEDIVLNVGIGHEYSQSVFYLMNIDTMSTFSKEQAYRLCKEFGFTIVDQKIVEIRTMNEISDELFDGRYPDFISVDVEGLDYEIMCSLDFKREGAYVICTETLEYSENDTGKKNDNIASILLDNGYFIYADTRINTIFVRNDWYYS